MQTLHIPTYIHTYWQCFLLCSPYIFLASFVLSFLVAFEDRICNWLQLIAKCIGLIRLKILRKTSSIQVWVEDWRFRKTSSIQSWIEDWRLKIEKLLQSNPDWRCEADLDWRSFSENLQSSSIQTWVEEVFLRIFNLQSRPGLKKFFWESSIFNLQSDTFCN